MFCQRFFVWFSASTLLPWWELCRWKAAELSGVRTWRNHEQLQTAGYPLNPKVPGWTGAGCLHSGCSILVQDHSDADPADLITCTAPETRFPGRRDSVARWKVLMRRETSLHRALTPAVCYSQEVQLLSYQSHHDHTPRGSYWVVSVWRMSSALSSVCTPLEPAGAALCYPAVKPSLFCRLISAEDESYLCVRSSGDDTWQSLFSALHSNGVSRQSLLN